MTRGSLFLFSFFRQERGEKRQSESGNNITSEMGITCWQQREKKRVTRHDDDVLLMCCCCSSSPISFANEEEKEGPFPSPLFSLPFPCPSLSLLVSFHCFRCESVCVSGCCNVRYSCCFLLLFSFLLSFQFFLSLITCSLSPSQLRLPNKYFFTCTFLSFPLI